MVFVIFGSIFGTHRILTEYKLEGKYTVLHFSA